MAVVVLAAFAATAHAADGPSFDCARAGSAVTRLICDTPALAAADRQLAEDYRAMQGQPGIDRKALEREETAWLHDVRNACADAACIARAYAERDAALLARSRRVASPAAADETQPFVAEPGSWAAARALRGSRCTLGAGLLRGGDFDAVPGSLPVVGNGSVVVVRRRRAADFAFLVDTRGGCRVVDVVALPPRAQAGDLLQCAVPAGDGSADTLSVGVGLRRPGAGKAMLAYWEVDVAAGQLRRQPLGVLGWEHGVRCQQPETAE